MKNESVYLVSTGRQSVKGATMKTINFVSYRNVSAEGPRLFLGDHRRGLGSRAKNYEARCGLVLALVLISFFVFSESCPAQSRLAKLRLHGERNVKDQENGYFDSTGRETIQPGVLTADKSSATSSGDVLTLLFDSAKVDLQTQNDVPIGTWVGTVRVPMRPGAKPKISYLQHVRGFVGKDKDSRVTILLDLGGTTHILNFPYGSVIQKDLLRQLISGVKPQSDAYSVTIVILAERRNPKSAVMVNLDSLDVEAKVPLKPKKK